MDDDGLVQNMLSGIHHHFVPLGSGGNASAPPNQLPGVLGAIETHFKPLDGQSGGLGSLDHVMAGAQAASQRGMSALSESMALPVAHVRPFSFGPRVGGGS